MNSKTRPICQRLLAWNLPRWAENPALYLRYGRFSSDRRSPYVLDSLLRHNYLRTRSLNGVSEAYVGARETLRKRFEERLRHRTIGCAIEINDAGLVLGAGTILARMTKDEGGEPILDLDADRQRTCALLAVVYGQIISPDVFRHIAGASEQWRRGDKVLAHIRLAFARLPRLKDRGDAYRLFVAETLLERGLSPRALMLALGFDPTASNLSKYDPDQPRVPAGSGSNSGQWTSGQANSQAAGSASVTSRPITTGVRAAVAIAAAGESGTLAEGLYAAMTGSEFLTGLAVLGGVVGAAAVLGTIFVPWQKNAISEGTIPGETDLRYSLDDDTGALRFLRQTETGQDVVALARRGRDGIFFEVETGLPVARVVGGSLVFDAASLANEAEDAQTRANTPARASIETDTTDKPQLCPDPGPDAPHGASERAIAYQAQISALNNPQRPLPPGLAVSLSDPVAGRRVVYDDCRESDGTMIEAKGPGFARLLQYSYFAKEVLPALWGKQASRQVAAAGPRDLEWYFAEPEAAEKAAEIFGNNELLQKVRIYVIAPKVP